MTKFYATIDTDGEGCISENADIFAFDTREAAEAYLRRGFDPADLDENGWTIGIEEGRFSDCWIKSSTEPAEDAGWIAPFAMDDLYVARPGQHPGGNRFWTTPRANVLVAVVKAA